MMLSAVKIGLTNPRHDNFDWIMCIGDEMAEQRTRQQLVAMKLQS